MIHNHDHAGAKWGGERGEKYAKGGQNLVNPPPH